MSHAVITRDLAKRFRGHEALHRVDLCVPEHSVYGLIGPNGAGKSTTLKVLMNILKPSSGTAEVLGTDSRKLRASHLAGIGYVSESQELPLWMTVGYFLNYLEPFYPAWDADYARRLVGQFDLPVDRKLGQLSRGMRMKAALVSSLAFHPRLLVLDEPFSGLDPMVREDLIEGLAECASETTILVSSHDLAEIETFASHVAYLDRGRIRFAEEMQSLSDRFREVEVTLRPGVRPVRELWPSDWLCPQESGTLLRFVDSRFDEEGTRRAIARFLGDGVQMSATPMPLKAVFVAMARSGSQAN